MSQMSQVAHESPGTERGQPDDAGLIAESCRAPERFGAVFDRHAAAIHGYIARRLGRDAADDLVAETFLVAFRQRGGYDPAQPSARPWLYGIATRLVSRRRRDEVRFFRAIARTGIDPAADPVAEPVADEGIRRADARTLHRPLAGALAGLAAADRDALLLVADGLSYAEAAQALGVPDGTLSSRVARARRKLREGLGGVNPADENEEQGRG
jgi:RNA polymerase sigma factor (sigma-70 family)